MEYNNTDFIFNFSGSGFNVPSEDIYESLLIKNYVAIFLYIPVIIAALAANTLVILVVVKYNFMRSVTNYFLVNLSVADLLVTLVCMPNAMWRAYNSLWIFGEVACKVANYLQCISVASSVFTITAMALDRYLAITRPFGFFSRCFNKRTTLIIIAALWTFSLILFVPVLSVAELEEITLGNLTITLCKENWNASYIPQHAFGITCFTAMFAVPGFLMLWAYSMMGRKLCSVIPPFDSNEGISSMKQSTRLIKERRRVAWILLLLALVFAICWLPHNVVILLFDTKNASDAVGYVSPYMLLLGHLNSALNPVIYCAMSRNFRRSVRHLMSRAFRRFGSSRRKLQWVDSSHSSQKLYMDRLKSVPPLQNSFRFNGSPFQSSQKTTRTCAV